MVPALVRPLPGGGDTVVHAGAFRMVVPAGVTAADLDRWFVWDRPGAPISWTVKGSKGSSYRVSKVAGGSLTCSCPGFKFHHKCKHLALVNQ